MILILAVNHGVSPVRKDHMCPYYGWQLTVRFNIFLIIAFSADYKMYANPFIFFQHHLLISKSCLKKLPALIEARSSLRLRKMNPSYEMTHLHRCALQKLLHVGKNILNDMAGTISTNLHQRNLEGQTLYSRKPASTQT